MRPLTISLLVVVITLFGGGTASAMTFAPMCVQPTSLPCLPTDEDDMPAMEVPGFLHVCEHVRCTIKP